MATKQAYDGTSDHTIAIQEMCPFLQDDQVVNIRVFRQALGHLIFFNRDRLGIVGSWLVSKICTHSFTPSHDDGDVSQGLPRSFFLEKLPEMQVYKAGYVVRTSSPSSYLL